MEGSRSSLMPRQAIALIMFVLGVAAVELAWKSLLAPRGSQPMATAVFRPQYDNSTLAPGCNGHDMQCSNVRRDRVTFIIPAIGRESLSRTVESLSQQTDGDWRALVVFDGVAMPTFPQDPRISTMILPKTGVHNYAGTIRNAGIEKACLQGTDWVAFVDDDDTLSPLYLETLRAHAQEYPKVDCIIFRMRYASDGSCLPPNNTVVLQEGSVGISFAFKPSAVGLRFRPSAIEDFDLLFRMQIAGVKMLLSPVVAYHVRGPPSNEGGPFNLRLIND